MRWGRWSVRGAAGVRGAMGPVAGAWWSVGAAGCGGNRVGGMGIGGMRVVGMGGAAGQRKRAAIRNR